MINEKQNIWWIKSNWLSYDKFSEFEKGNLNLRMSCMESRQQPEWSLHKNGGQVYEDKMLEISSDHRWWINLHGSWCCVYLSVNFIYEWYDIVCFKQVIGKDVIWHIAKRGESAESNYDFIMTEDGEDPSISSQSFDSIHYGDKGSITEEEKSYVKIRHEWKHV